MMASLSNTAPSYSWSVELIRTAFGRRRFGVACQYAA